MNPRRFTPLLAVAALVAGCADPYQQKRPVRDEAADRPVGQRQPAPAPNPSTPAKPRLPDPPASGELPGQVPAELADEPTRFPEAGQRPQQTLALGARLYGNWTSANAAERFRAIAALSVGQARAELRQAAAQSATDPQQQGLRSQASIEAIKIDGAGRERRALIATRQKVVGPGLPAAGWRYQVTTVRLQQRAGKWVIARWTPQP